MSAFVEIEFDNKDGRFPTGQSHSGSVFSCFVLRRADPLVLAPYCSLYTLLPTYLLYSAQQASPASSSAAPSDSRRTSTSSTASRPARERSCPSSRVPDSAGVTRTILFLKAG